MAKRAKIGDIIEIKISVGYAYMQYTQKDSMKGALIRVFKGTYKDPLENLSILEDKEIQFITFFPLQYAIKEGIVKVVGNMELREEFKKFPIFKNMLGQDLKTNKAKSWNLWDGEKIIGIIKPPLTQEQKMLPISGTINDTMLIERIENEWTADKCSLI